MSTASVGVPVLRNAKLPDSYAAARAAIAKCAKVDECKSWADKAEAIASYARQADDETLMKNAMRIKARAIQRCGVLLRQFEAKSGDRRGGGSPAVSARNKAAQDAGLSRDQRKQAQRVAAYSEADPHGFDQAVEGDDPATITELAARGTRKKKPSLAHLGGRDPEDFKAATQWLGLVDQLDRDISKLPPIAIALRGLNKREKTEMRKKLRRCAQFCTSLMKEL